MKKVAATITVEWGYELHSLKLTNKQWTDIKSGKHIKIKGEGYFYEGENFPDFWVFNADGHGSLTVAYGDDGGEGWKGALDDAEVTESDQ